MKAIFLALTAMLFLTPPLFAREQSVLARVTVYWAGGPGSDRWTRRHICSTGARLQAGHCAVDPRRIPYGSKVTMPDGTLLAVDTGSAVRSRKAARRAGRTTLERNALVIDRFFETKQQALSWARRNPYFMFVRVTPPDLRSGAFPALRQETTQTILPDPRPNPVAAPSRVAQTSRRSLDDRQVRRPGWMP
jgi:3D (Asp-Asp-Asp) domain-containing protein